MLTIKIQGDEMWDEETEKFVYSDPTVLQFEHSLVSVSKWEAEFHKLFVTPEPKSEEEMFGYVRAMLLTPDVDDETLRRLDAGAYDAIDAYINNPMTGTTFHNIPEGQAKTSERISSELIYYWMYAFGIPKDHEHDHLNRLFTMIKLHQVKQQKPKKMSKQARVQSMAELNAQRKARLGTSG